MSKCCYKYFILTSLNFQVEGKGNGIKTVIVNMVEIAKALQRPPACKKFICCGTNYSVSVKCLCYTVGLLPTSFNTEIYIYMYQLFQISLELMIGLHKMLSEWLVYSSLNMPSDSIWKTLHLSRIHLKQKYVFSSLF